jgi:tetratricopeptide (TPR) repeat protein
VRNKPPASISRPILDSFREEKFFYLLTIFFVIYAWVRERPMGAIIPLSLLACWLIFRYWVAAPGILYHKINQAKDWHRWLKVTALLDKAEWLRGRHFIKIPETELIKIRAQALAGINRLPEALELFKQCENRPDCPQWMFKSAVGELYNLSKQYDRGFEFARQAAEESPTSLVYLDVANYYLRRNRNNTAARAAMAKVDDDAIPQPARYFLPRCRGILAFNEGNYEVARQELEESIKMVEAQKNLPFRDGSLSILKAYLASALGQQGNMAKAINYFSEAEPYLIATEETELLDQCRAIVGRV